MRRRVCSASTPATAARKSRTRSARSFASSTSSRRSRAAIRSSSSLQAALPSMTPGDLNRIFFTNSGSEAVDTAMKVALAYWQAKGQGGRTMFISRERAYHGVNFGGVSLAGHGEQPAPVRADAARHCAHAAYAHQGKLFSAGRGHATASSSPRIWCASSICTAPRTSRRASSSRSPARPAAWCRRRDI